MRISRRGEVVIPKPLRERLRWREGDILDPQLEGDRLILCRVASLQPVAPETPPDGGAPDADSADLSPTDASQADLSPNEALLLGEMDVPLFPDALHDHSGLPIDRVLASLTSLEIKGLVRRTAHGSYARVVRT